LQYNYLDDFFRNIIHYCKKHGFKINSDNISIEHINSVTYIHYKNTALKRIKIKTSNNNKLFLDINIPELIQDHFFIINDVKYIPTLYIADEPIVIKKFSILLYSLFAPITIYHKKQAGKPHCILLGNNIPIEYFFRVLFRSKVDSYLSWLKLNPISYNDLDILQYFQTIFSNIRSYDDVIENINNLFFDNWTKELYSRFYDIEPSIVDVIKLAINKKNNNNYSFTDLRFKRIIFIEPLLRPITKIVTRGIIGQMKGTDQFYLNIKPEAIVQFFINQLQRNYLFDVCSGYSSIIAYKASFKNPFSEKKKNTNRSILPKTIADIHQSHKYRICPVTVSSQKPGETISLVPNQKIESKFGMFI